MGGEHNDGRFAQSCNSSSIVDYSFLIHGVIRTDPFNVTTLGYLRYHTVPTSISIASLHSCYILASRASHFSEAFAHNI